MPSKDAIFGGSAKYPTNPKRQTPPPVGSYSGGSVEQAANRTEATPGSKAPGRDSNNNQITSGQPGPRGPFTSTSDNARAKELLKSENPAKVDRSGSFFR